MDTDPLSVKITQPALFDFRADATGAMELFPAVWSALEDLIAPDPAVHRGGLERLLELGAPRLSPLVVYILATRLSEPDIRLRAKIVQALGAVLAPDAAGLAAPEPVARHLNAYLSQMNTVMVADLVDATVADCSAVTSAARLLNACPYAGVYLAEILSDRKQPLALRTQAVYLTGLVGFLDAVPTLERLEARLASRLEGQQTMPFAPPIGPDETELLPALRIALEQLRSR